MSGDLAYVRARKQLIISVNEGFVADGIVRRLFGEWIHRIDRFASNYPVDARLTGLMNRLGWSTPGSQTRRNTSRGVIAYTQAPGVLY